MKKQKLENDTVKRTVRECDTFEFDRRGKVIDGTPRAKAGCDEWRDPASKSDPHQIRARESH